MAILESYVQSGNHKQSFTRTYHQDEPREGEAHAYAKLSILDIVHKLFHSLERVFSSKKGPIVPTGTIINPFKTDKTAANGNLRLCPKLEPQAKCHQNLPPGWTSEGEARARQALDLKTIYYLFIYTLFNVDNLQLLL